jgi:tetratricopeptide (TPR) repeat protein
VTYIADLSSDETETSCNQSPNVETEEQIRFSESMTFLNVYDENIVQEPTDRSYKQFDKDFIFRYMMMMCLRDAPSFPSDKNNLIKLFETKDFVLPKEIEKFSTTYSASEALHIYTRDEFIYGKLNSALRTTNIFHLLSFRFLLQDIYNQLRELMEQQTDDQVLIVYRGQQASSFEIADLYAAFNHHRPITNTSFLSTSKDRNTSLVFIRSSGINWFNPDRSLILFKITARKQDASQYCPFADISKVSNHSDEKEVLFTPGQMFIINKFDIISENDMHIFSFEISLKSGFNEESIMVNDKFKNLCDGYLNDPLICLAGLLTDYKRFDEAKELCIQVLSEYNDKNKKYACYQGLFKIAADQNDTNQAKLMFQKMTETKFGTEQLLTNLTNIPVSEIITSDYYSLINMYSQMSLDRPLDELLADIDSGKFLDAFEQITSLQYKFGTIFMKNDMYAVAIQVFELVLHTIKSQETVLFDPLLKARCHMQLGHCYRDLKLYDTALENYKVTFEQSVQLQLDEYIETSFGSGAALEATNNYEEALTKYIEVAQIYQNDSTKGSLEERHNIEECIQRVISNLISLD